MLSSALRPRSVTEIVDASFQILRAHYPAFVMCSAIAYAPQLLIRLLLVGDPQRFTALDPAMAGEVAWIGLVTAVTGLITFSLMTAVLTTCTSQAYLGEPVDVEVAVRRAIQRLGALLVTAVLATVLLVVSLFFLLAPAMYVTARLFAVTPALILEDRSISGAFARSGTLSSGRKWHILNTLGLVILIYFVFFLGVSIVGTVFGGYVVQTVLAALVTICLYPVIAIAGVLLYYDARIQSEGLDLELLADALPALSPVVP